MVQGCLAPALSKMKTVEVRFDFCGNLLVNLYLEFKHKSCYVNPAEFFNFPMIIPCNNQWFNTQ